MISNKDYAAKLRKEMNELHARLGMTTDDVQKLHQDQKDHEDISSALDESRNELSMSWAKGIAIPMVVFTNNHIGKLVYEMSQPGTTSRHKALWENFVNYWERRKFSVRVNKTINVNTRYYVDHLYEYPKVVSPNYVDQFDIQIAPSFDE